MPQKRTKDYQIELSIEQIPAVRNPMPVMKLGAPVMAPKALFQRMARAVAPNAKFSKMGKSGALAAYDGNRLVAFMDSKSGESRVFPLLESLNPGQSLAEQAKLISTRVARDPALFPRDGTDVVPLPPVTLMGSRRAHGRKPTAPLEYLSFVRFQRRVNGMPVFGPGTRAAIAVGEDGSIRALTHRWKKATPTDIKVAPRPPAVILKLITKQLTPSAKNADVRLDKVSLAYYDGGGRYLQPVYRFTATIMSRPKVRQEPRAANRHVFGFVLVGTAPEPLPILSKIRGKRPLQPLRHVKRAKIPKRAAPAGDPTVGRYVVRNDSDEWVTSANEFLSGLQLAQGLFGGPIPFTDSQYYWAMPFEYVSNKDSFVNSVNIALTESHGNWSWFSTRDNNDDGVSLSTIPSSGYGGGSGGALAYWIIHSCEVIPTQTDESTSFDVWWNIFNGLHAVVGYRTEMWIDDDVTGPFGFLIGLGAPVVSAWLNEVASNDSYDDGDTYHDGNRDMDEPMGRASAVVVCGHSDDTANDIGSLGRANCLTEWWFGN